MALQPLWLPDEALMGFARMTPLTDLEQKMVRDVTKVLDSISGTRKPFNHHHYYLQSRTAETLQDNLRDGGADRNAPSADQ